MTNNEGLIKIKSRLISPGESNSAFKHCFAITHFQGKRLIAYGSGSNVVITSDSFYILDLLKGHRSDSIVKAVSWSTYSGRLSSFASNQNDYRQIIIWEPNRITGKWKKLQEINCETEINCLSWSKGDNILCTATDQNFQIHVHEESNKSTGNNFMLNTVYTEQIPTEFCSHSRDSRFILTMPKIDKADNEELASMKGVVIYYKRGRLDGDYRKIYYRHPSRVISARWRTSDQAHGNCCFMTVTQDRVVRIWYETCVNENFKFSVVASLPSEYNILVASFISSTSKNISSNPIFDDVDNNENDVVKVDEQNNTFTQYSKLYKDAYGYGNGHFVKRDSNYRECNVADPTEIKQNFFYFLTFDQKQSLAIWKVSGLSTSVRTTPRITKLLTRDIQLGMKPNSVNNIYAYCLLTSEYSHYNDINYIAHLNSLSLILQNNLTGSLTRIDLSINSQKLSVSNYINIHGHKSKIKSIRINKDFPFMISLGENTKNNVKEDSYGQPIVWKFNDTDVYDPSKLASFIYQIEINFIALDWLYTNKHLIGYNGESFSIIELLNSNAPITTPLTTNINFRFNNLHSNNVLQFRVLCGNEEYYIMAMLFEHDFYLLYLHQQKISELLHIQELNDTFVDLFDSYISQLFHEAGALLCVIATKHVAYSVILNNDLISFSRNMSNKPSALSGTASVTPSKPKPILVIPQSINKVENEIPTTSVASYVQIITVDEEIHSLCFIHPAYYIIACSNVIYFCRKYCCSKHDIKVFQKVNIDYIPKLIRCNPHGMISVLSDDKIELYHQVRKSPLFNQSNLQWELIAMEKTQASTAEWSLDGFLIYASNENIYCLTKYMDTYFYDETKMFPTIHYSVATRSKSIPDFDPAILIPLAVSGRYDLLLNMLDFFKDNIDNSRMNWFYQDFVINYDEKSKKPYSKDVNELIDSFLSESMKSSETKIFGDRIDEFIHFISKLPKLLAIKPESLDQRSIAVARAISLDETHSIPFDLINIAYISPDQVKLMDYVNFQNWDSILNSGVFFWMKDLKVLNDKIIPFCINNFSERRDVAIIVLTIARKFVVLKTLFKKAGDEARAAFFGRDFSKPKEKKSAEKNGYSALSKHDFYTSAAMFCLSGNINVAIRILLQNANDVALAYLVCRYVDDGKQSLNKIIDEFLMPKAIETNDYAAIDFFNKQKNHDYQYSLDDRIRSLNCGNLISSSNSFYDMRFVSCEILPTSVEQKADFCLCLLLSGANFLSTIYLSYLGKYVLHKDDSPMAFPESRSITFDVPVKSFDEKDDEFEDEIDDASEMEVSVKEVEAFSFGGCDGTNFNISSDDFSSSSDFESDSSENEEESKKEPIKKEPIQKQEVSQKSTNSKVLFRRKSTTNFDHNEYEKKNPVLPNLQKQTIKFATNNNKESFPVLKFSSSNNSSNSTDEHENLEAGPRSKKFLRSNSSALIRRKSSCFASQKNSLLNPGMQIFNSGYNFNPFDNGNQENSESCKNISQIATSALNRTVKSDESFTSDDEDTFTGKPQTSTLSSSISKNQKLQSHVNWVLDVIVFNIARLRLEQFTSVKFCNGEDMTSLIQMRINESEGNIKSMMRHFTDYLIRSCKRRGIISRRLLLISSQGKKNFIQEMCKCMFLLPDQFISSKFTKQQIAQISRTTQTLIDTINRDLVDFSKYSTLFVSVFLSILTSIYIISIYKHDVKIMLKLLEASFDFNDYGSFINSFKDFINSDSGNLFRDFLHVDFIPLDVNLSNMKYIKSVGTNYVFLISNEMKKAFTPSSKYPNLPQYVSSLVDFLCIDTFFQNIKNMRSSPLGKKIKSNASFKLLLDNLKKVYNNVTQLFTYSTINFPSFLKFDSLSTICSSSNNDLNQLTNYLISLNNREETIKKYSNNMIRKYSLNSSNSSIYNYKSSSKKAINTSLSRIGSQNESNISTINFSNLNDNINCSHNISCFSDIFLSIKLNKPKTLFKSSSSIFSISFNKESNSLFFVLDNAIKTCILINNSKNELDSGKEEGIFLDIKNNEDEVMNDFNKKQEEEDEKDSLVTEPLTDEPASTEESVSKESNKNSLPETVSTEESVSKESNETSLDDANYFEDSCSESGKIDSQSLKSRKSKSSKPPLQPNTKSKSSGNFEVPTCIVMSPTENSILVGYKNGRVDLIFISKKEGDNDLSESSEVSEIFSKKELVKSASNEDMSSINKIRSNASFHEIINDKLTKSGSIDNLQKENSNKKGSKGLPKRVSSETAKDAVKSEKRKSSKGITKSISDEDSADAVKSEKRKSSKGIVKSISDEDSADAVKSEKRKSSKGIVKSISNEDFKSSDKSDKKKKKKETAKSLKRNKKDKIELDVSQLTPISEKGKKSKDSGTKRKKSKDFDSSEISYSADNTSDQLKSTTSIEFKYNSRVVLNPPNNTSCSCVAFSNNGKIAAAVNGRFISLWSLSMKLDRPFSVIDTFSENCLRILFLQGTGILVTAQIESATFKGNLCFWDILLPNRASLIASLELKEQYGTALSLAYSPSFSKILMGTSRGFTLVVDTKSFSVIYVIQSFTKKLHEAVSDIAIDPQQYYFATASSSGNVKIWDLKNYKKLDEIENVHTKKMLKSRGKIREFSISSIAINDLMIYTSGYDGCIKSLEVNLQS